MTGLFDGLASLLGATFGSSVSVTPVNGVPRTLEGAVFREQPTRVLTQDGSEIVTVLPTLSAIATDVADLVPGSLVEPGNGKTYRCNGALPSGSPAADAHVVIQLERTDAPA